MWWAPPPAVLGLTRCQLLCSLAPPGLSWAPATADGHCQLHGHVARKGSLAAQRAPGSPGPRKPLFRAPWAENSQLRGFLGTGLTPPNPAVGTRGPIFSWVVQSTEPTPTGGTLPAHLASPSSPFPKYKWGLCQGSSQDCCAQTPKNDPTAVLSLRSGLSSWTGLHAVLRFISKYFLISTMNF